MAALAAQGMIGRRHRAFGGNAHDEVIAAATMT